MKGGPDYRIEAYGRGRPAPAAILARLHAELLPSSPIVRLGGGFAAAYYRLLPRADGVFGAVAYVDDQPAGFVAGTFDSHGFMRAGLLRYGPCFVWPLGVALLGSPRRLRSLGETWRIMNARTAVDPRLREGEVLSLGVLAPFRNARFVRSTGFRIADDLMEHAMGRFRDRGLPLVRVVIDKENLPAQIFYRMRGWTLERGEVPGWTVPSVEFAWRP